MGRKVFLSFLGNTDYKPLTYSYKGKDQNPGTPTPFVQEILFDLFCSGWEKEEEENKIIVICTDGENGSYKTNYENNGRQLSLDKTLENKQYYNIVGHRIISSEVQNNAWLLFKEIKEIIPENADVYLDITNAFRSITLFASTLLDYIKIMKNATLKCMYYGLKKDDFSGEIIDMSNIIQLQKYTKIADAFINYGRIKIEKEDCDKDLWTLVNAINDYDNFIIANRLDAIKIGAYANQIHQHKKRIESSNIEEPLKDVLYRITDRFTDYKQNSEQNVEYAIEWAIKYHMLPQAYTLGYEHLITLAYNFLKDAVPNYKEDKKKREFVGSILGIPSKEAKNRIYKNEMYKFPKISDYLLNIDWIKNLRANFKEFANGRIKIDHAKDKSTEYDKLVRDFNKYYHPCLDCLKNEAWHVEPIPENGDCFFINITNTPYETWSEAKKAAAKEKGKIINLCTDSISNPEIFDAIISKITDISNGTANNSTVLIEGDLFTGFTLVSRLMRMGYRCVTTEYEKASNGEKVFTGFKEYKS